MINIVTSNLLLFGLIAFCFALSVFFLIAAVTMKGESEGRQFLIRATREVGRTRIVDNQSSFNERMLDPVLRRIASIGWRLTPAERLRILDQKLDAAGYPAGWDLNRLVLCKVLCMLFGLAIALFVTLTMSIGFGIILIVILGGLGLYMPDIVLSKFSEKRTQEMRRTLADTVDLLNLTLAAGIGFDASLKLVSQNTTGALAQEFGRVVQEITIGKSRAEALRALAERTNDEDVRRFCMTCVQADRRGTPIGEILRLQSNELRIKRRQLAEEQAQKVPVKILFPTMCCVLPVLLVVVIGPAAIQLMTTGLGGGN